MHHPCVRSAINLSAMYYVQLAQSQCELSTHPFCLAKPYPYQGCKLQCSCPLMYTAGHFRAPQQCFH
jgi:hypothetical protein